MFQNALDWLDFAFSLVWTRKPHADYYSPESCYRFNKPLIVVYVDPLLGREGRAAWGELVPLFQEAGIGVVFADYADNADVRPGGTRPDVIMVRDRTVPKGGVTHTDRDKNDPSILIRAVIHIAEGERGSSLVKTIYHENTHLWHEGHSDDRRDANCSPCYIRRFSPADNATFRKAYSDRK